MTAAIADGLVKVPVIVYRRDGHRDVQTQLADACHLRSVKEAAYQSWSEGSGEQFVNPVLFVVCQTVQDAQEAAALLAGDGYIGDPGAVLVITSQSSDQALTALAAVEEPGSPIRAVVSVDKLKEGWDVKNIGAIVALRRLASQALTEQVLGRGLRLPYGRRVGVPMIDQVDLVAHDSYRRLLEQKDALIERIAPSGTGAVTGETVPRGGADVVRGGAVPAVSIVETQDSLRLVTPARVIDGDVVDGTAALILLEYGIAEAEGQRDAAEYRVLQRVPGAPQIVFPRREQEVLPLRFSLSFVDDADARASGAGFAREITIPLIREALVARRTLDGGLQVRREAQEVQEAHQAWFPLAQVEKDLETRVLALGLVEQSLAELNAARRVVGAFLAGAGATANSEVEWGAERVQQALHGIDALIRQKYDTRRLQPRYAFRPVTLPVEPRPMPTDVLDRYDDFERGRWYSGWRRSVLPVASFDARTTERSLAEILDGSPRITWWLRLQTTDPAYVELDTGGRYFADFVAVDTDDVRWLIEGKSDHDVQRRDVEAKRAAAEEWARFVNDDGRFGTWRCLFCSERAIKDAHGGWDSLLAASRATV